jgi:hypothetical protein
MCKFRKNTFFWDMTACTCIQTFRWIVLPYLQSAMKTEARCSETSVNIHHATRRHNLEDSILYSHCLRASDLVELLYIEIRLAILFANCESNSTSISSDGHIMNNLKCLSKEKNNKKPNKEREERKLPEYLRSKSARNASVLLLVASAVTTS